MATEPDEALWPEKIAKNLRDRVLVYADCSIHRAAIAHANTFAAQLARLLNASQVRIVLLAHVAKRSGWQALSVVNSIAIVKPVQLGPSATREHPSA